MTEQIYIDGNLMDIAAGGGGVQLVYQSPYFTDLKSIVSNRTNSVSLPATANNLRVIGTMSGNNSSDLAEVLLDNNDILQDESYNDILVSSHEYRNFAYCKHEVIYKRDGIQLLNGTATLLSVTRDTITMCFVWGNTTAFSPLFEVSARELCEVGQLTERYCPYADFASYIYTTHSMYIKYGMDRSQPVLIMKGILERIAARFGITGINNIDEWNSLCVPLLTRIGDATTKKAQGVHLGSPAYAMWDFDLMHKITALKCNGSDAHNSMNGFGVIDVSGVSKVRVVFKGSFRKTQYSSINAQQQLALYYDDGEGWSLTHGVVIATPTHGGGSVWNYTANYDQEIDVSAWSSICIAVMVDNLNNNPPTFSNVQITDNYVILDPSVNEDVVYGVQSVGGIAINNYPMYANLPDISCGQLLKNLMLITGRFAYSKREGEILFTTLAELYAHRANPYNWTNKLINSAPNERTTILDSVAQKNWLRYKEDEGISTGTLDYYMTCDDENVDAETTLFESDFSLAPNDTIICWQSNGEDIDFVGDSRKPRLLRVQSDFAFTARNDESLTWENIIATYYQEYQRVILHPVVIKVSVLMNTADLQALDLTIPVYLRQTGRYYCIKQLTTKNGTEAEATLIQL